MNPSAKKSTKLSILALLIFLFVLRPCFTTAQQSVSIGDTQVKSNAVLYLKGNGSQGLIIPVASDHNAVTKAAGMIVFDSGDGKIYSSDGNTWIAMSGGSNGTVSYTLTLSGNNLLLKDATNTVSTVPLSSPAPSANQFLMWNGTQWTAVSLSQDITSTNGTVTVNGLKAKALPSLPVSGTQALVYDGTSGVWKFSSASTGTVTQVAAGTGLTGGPITTTGTLNVDVGTTANKIVQLDGTGKLPAIDGSQLTNLPSSATSLNGLSDVTVTTPTNAQILVNDATGQFNNVSVSGDIAMTNTGAVTIQNGKVTAAKLANTTVTAGTYGSTTQVPQFTVDAQGRITNASNQTIAAAATTLDALTDATITSPAGGQILLNDGLGQFRNIGVSGDVAISSTGVSTIQTGAVSGTKLSNTGVTAGSYGNGSQVAQITVDAQGRVTSASNIAISAGASTLDGLTDAIVTSPTSGQILVNNGLGQFANVSVSGDLAISTTGAATIQTGAVTATKLANTAVTAGTYGSTTQVAQFTVDAQGRITNASNQTVAAGASTLDGLTDATVTSPTSGQILVNNGLGQFTNVSVSGDVAITSAGLASVQTGVIKDSHINSSAAIAGTKITPNFGAQDITTTGKTILNTVSYTWPNVQGAASTVLTNDGAGGLTWASAGGSSLITNPGTQNLFAGVNSGTSNTGSNNAFFGYGAGQANTSAINNSFFGAGAGQVNTTGTENTFLGRSAGAANLTGNYNVYVGKDAGKIMATGSLNTFVGYQAGHSANGIDASTFIGRLAGGNTTSGLYNTFVGEQSGLSNTTGQSNTFVGRNTGTINLTGGTISLLGSGADVGADGLTNATAIGANAVVSASNALVLGNNTTVGIGTSSPGNKLHINNSTAVNTYSQFTNSLTGTTSSDGLLVGVASTGIATINYQEANDFKIQNNLTTPIWMNSAGHTAINGTPDATHTLLVYGSNESIGVDNTGVVIGDVNGNSFGNYFQVDFESIPRFMFMGAKVGVGTTSPSADLHVAPNSSTYAFRIDQGSTGHGILSYVNTTAPSQTLLSATSNSGNLTVLGDGSTTIACSNVGNFIEHLNATYSGGTAGLIKFSRSGTLSGSITENSGTVSYNAFTGSHFAHIDQLIERGMLVTLTGKNVFIPGNTGEPVYGVVPTAEANDSKILGTYLSPLPDSDAPNTHQVMAVGNGEVWVIDNGSDLKIGDYLISSGTSGHAMKENGEFEIAYIFARVAEPVNWNEVHETINGVKHTKISIFFESFTKNNKADKLQSQIDQMKADIEYLKQMIGAEAKKDK